MAVPLGTIVGSWYAANPGGGTDQIVYTFLADGTFLVGDKGTHERDPSGTSGLEWGSYLWDSASSNFSAMPTINTDGAWGLSDTNWDGASVKGDILTFTGAGGVVEISRLLSADGSIVGSWYAANPGGGTDQIVFSFFADGTYIISDKGTVAHDPTGTSGIEWGTYTWDAATGDFSFQTQVNTDGQWGLSDSHGEVTKLILTGDTLTAGNGTGGMALTRMSPVGNVVNGTAGVDSLTGTVRNDTIYGLAGNDNATGGYGNDTIDGGSGIDAATYVQTHSAFTLTKTANGYTLDDHGTTEGTDTLLDIERLHFNDTSVALDLSGSAGNVAKTLGAVFGSDYVSNRAYVGIGLAYADSGLSFDALMQLALNVRLGATHTHTQVVNLLYGNVIGGTISPTDLASYVGLLDGGSYTEAQLGVIAANTTANANHIGLTGLIQAGIEYT